MTLRHDSIYSVDLRDPPPPSASSPPPVLQLRLTEQALEQLAQAYASSDSQPSIQLDLASSAPSLVIAGAPFSLQKAAESAPHELYRLDQDETTLTKLGTVQTKLGVRPSMVSASAASRLKEKREEQDLRKEERRKALLVDQPLSVSNPKRSNSRQSKPGIAIHARNSTSSPAGAGTVSTSSVARSSSLNKLSMVRDSGSREGQISPSPLRGAPSVASSSKRTGLGSPFSASRVLSPDTKGKITAAQSPAPSSKSRHSVEDPHSQQDSYVSDSESLTSPKASSSSSAAVKKGSKLTTRQRLSKAAKGGSRILQEAEKKAAPETPAKAKEVRATGFENEERSSLLPKATGVAPLPSQLPPKQSSASPAARREKQQQRASPLRDSNANRSTREAIFSASASVDRAKRESVSSIRKRPRSPSREVEEVPSVSKRHEPLPRIAKRSSPPCPSVKGVGPGAAHWTEPWLDVRSRSDWAKLAERFARSAEEYTASRRRLDIESARLDIELDLAGQEHATQADRLSEAALNAATDIGLSIANEPTRRDSVDSLEEGEMTSDSERPSASISRVAAAVSIDVTGSALGLTTDSTRTRSASPENLVWRSRNRPPSSQYHSESSRTTASPPPHTPIDQPPLTYKELALLVEKHRHLHGSLERMQNVLVEFKNRADEFPKSCQSGLLYHTIFDEVQQGVATTQGKGVQHASTSAEERLLHL